MTDQIYSLWQKAILFPSDQTCSYGSILGRKDWIEEANTARTSNYIENLKSV